MKQQYINLHLSFKPSIRMVTCNACPQQLAASKWYDGFCILLGGLLLALLLLPTILSAQTTTAINRDSTAVSFMGRQVNRVPDPQSNHTEWIDNYIIEPATMSQGKEGEIKDIVLLHFRLNSTVLDPLYMDNANALEVIDRILRDTTLLGNGTNFAVILGSASPEGDAELNTKLAQGRALSTKNAILNRHPHINRDKIVTYAIDEDWTGFRQLVVNDIYLPDRNEVIQILDLNIPNKQKLANIKVLNGGNAYRYITANIFPTLRGGVSCTFVSAVPQPPTIEYRDREVEVLRVDTVYIEKPPVIVPPIPKRAKQPYYLVVKNNLLYDAALLPNLAIEFDLGKRWSVEVEAMHSWWNTKDDTKYHHRIQTGGLEARKWLGSADKTPFTGHFVGAYVMGGTYDVKYQKEKGSLSNWSYSAGLTYGYAMPLARRFNLEFAIGVGYVAGTYQNYTFDRQNNCYSKIETFDRTYVGLTKAKVSLVWLIGSGVNQQKGGKR